MDKKKQVWLEEFPLSEGDITSFNEENTSESLIFWSLNLGLVPREPYIKWASSKYNLPYLPDSPSLQASSKAAWKKVGSFQDLPAHCLPVCLWRDLVYLACMEPPEEEKEGDSRYQFVLVDDKTFKKLQEVQASAFPEQEQEREGNYDIIEKENERVGQEETRTLCTIVSTDHYKDFWKQMQNHFGSCIVLKNEEGSLYPLAWYGHISIQNTEEVLAHLSESSFLRLLSQNLDYHGFVVDTPKNREILKKMGWANLPKHVTACSLMNKQGQKRVFIGISPTPILKDHLEKIKDICKKFFETQEENQGLKVA